MAWHGLRRSGARQEQTKLASPVISNKKGRAVCASQLKGQLSRVTSQRKRKGQSGECKASIQLLQAMQCSTIDAGIAVIPNSAHVTLYKTGPLW